MPNVPEPSPQPAAGQGARAARVSDTAALPVVIDAGPCTPEVRNHVEGVLGWQPVDVDTAVLVPPVLWLVGPASSPAPADVPRLLLLPDGSDPVAAAEAGARHGAGGVVAWPSGRERLEVLAGRLLAAPPVAEDGPETIRVVGAGGGVGTSTVTLALAGLAAWRGARVLVLAGPDAPVGDVRRIPAEALSSHDLLRRASELPGVAGARVVVTDGATGRLPDRLADLDLVLVDGGTGRDGDVVVCRPDRVALERLSATTAGSVVVNGEGPVSRAALTRAAGGRVCVELPTSARVARAVLHARVPTSLPGTWLRRLAPVVPGARA